MWNLPEETDTKQDVDPKMVSEINHPGDVTDLVFLNNDVLLAASSTGSVFLHRLQRNQSFKQMQKWEHVHAFKPGAGPQFRMCPCTSVTVRNDNIITVGEDGRLVHLNVKHKDPIHVIDSAETCTINAVLFLKQFEVVTANMRGQLKVWDLRSKSNSPVQKFILSGDQVGLQCLAQHPGQHQVLATGSEDGTLVIWDMRQDKYPATLLPAHNSCMFEVQFHPDYPNHLFSCSQDGSAWHWDCSGISQAQVNPLQKSNKAMEADMSEPNPWLVCTATKHRMEINSLLASNRLPINSLDVQHNTLLCGGDNEAFFIIRNLDVKS